MSCPTDLTLSIHADGELAPAEGAAVERHLAGCPRCRALAGGLGAENRLLRAALELPPVAAALAARPVQVHAAAVAGLALLVAATLRVVAGKLGGSLTGVPDWLNPLALAGGLNLMFNTVFYLPKAGGAVMEWSGSLISTTLPVLAVALLAAWMARRWPRTVLAAVCLLAAVGLAPPAAALEIRDGQNVEVAAGETVEGTIVLAGETVRVEGRVEGDVLAFGRDVTVRGTVTGAVYAFGQQVNLEGESGGPAHGFGQWVRMTGAAMGNGYFMAQGVSLLPGSRVDGDVLMMGETLTVEGAVARDVTACGRRAEIRGGVGRHVETWTDEVEVAGGAAVGGNLVAHLPAAENLEVAAGTVAGETSVELEEPSAAKSRYRSPGFYLWRLVSLVGAFLVGAVLWRLAPGLLGGRLEGAGPALVRLGIGLVVLVAVPIVLIVVAITIIGLPLAVIGLVLYAICLYLAKIATADLVGRGLLGWPEETPRRALPALLLGLAIVTVAVSLPWVGGWIGFLVLLFGLGLMTRRIWRGLQAEGAD